MDRKKDIIKCINSISGKYSSYEVFSDWIKCSSLFISNSLELFHGKVWKDREQAYIDSITRYNKTEQKMFSDMFLMLAETLEFKMSDVLGEIYMDSGMGSKAAGIDEETARKATWVSQFIMEYYGCGIGQGLNNPLHTIVTKDRFALITVLGNEYAILDIFLRMLTPEELKLAQGFPPDYIIDRDYNWKKYPVCEQVKRIGNSVVPIMAEALIKANCPYLKVGERQPAPVMYMQKNGQVAFG